MYLSKQQRLEYQERRDEELMSKKSHRALHHQITDKADELLLVEAQLIRLLELADASKLHSFFGFRSLRGYCTEKLRLSRIQSQRIVTIARRRNYSRDLGSTQDKLGLPQDELGSPQDEPSSVPQLDSQPEFNPFLRTNSLSKETEDDQISYLDTPDMSHLPIRKWMLR